MKVKYIGESGLSLTYGETYTVIAIERDWYRIGDNTGEDYLFSPDEFTVIEE